MHLRLIEILLLCSNQIPLFIFPGKKNLCNFPKYATQKGCIILTQSAVSVGPVRLSVFFCQRHDDGGGETKDKSIPGLVYVHWVWIMVGGKGIIKANVCTWHGVNLESPFNISAAFKLKKYGAP